VQEIEGDQPHVGKVPIITENASATEISVSEEESDLRAALKYSSAALKADGVPFALGGGYALWVRGGPEPVHDVDLVVSEQDVSAAVNSLSEAGFTVERPPEDWLFKAWWEDSLVDVLHKLRGLTVTRDLVASADEIEVLGVRIPVLPPTPIVIAKLHSLSEHYGDFGAMLPTFRAVREQLDWPQIRAEVAGHPYAEAFLFLLERLEIIEPAP
jgi:hypothetical protein